MIWLTRRLKFVERRLVIAVETAGARRQVVEQAEHLLFLCGIGAELREHVRKRVRDRHESGAAPLNHLQLATWASSSAMRSEPPSVIGYLRSVRNGPAHDPQ